MLSAQARSQVAIGHLMGVLNPLVFSNDDKWSPCGIYYEHNVLVDAALANLHRATKKANISTKATS